MKSIKGNKASQRLVIFAVIVTVAGLFWIVFDAGRPTSSVVRYEAIGDSITFGRELSFEVDRRGRPRKTSERFRGWPALLGHMLTQKTGQNTTVSNNGHPGIRAVKSSRETLIGNSNAMHTLLMIGTNDSNTFDPAPSGQGCAGVACSNTYKEKLQLLIHSLREAGRQNIYLGMLLPVWGTELDEPYPDPLDLAAAPRNARIVAYNKVISDELLTLPGVRPGPDFYSCFLSPSANRFSLFEDALHPNKLGYLMMAALWRNALSATSAQSPLESCPAPIYILESLDPYEHGHKQNLLEVGDAYYTDESFVLADIPSELADGAHDPDGIPPLSSSHEFRPVTLATDLIVSDPEVGAFSLVRAVGVTGTISIGGNRSGFGAPPQQSYVVVVVP